MSELGYDLLLSACSAGGPSCLSSVTDLAPAGGWHTSVAPARFAPRDSNVKGAVYAWEHRFVDGELVHAVLIDSKQSQLNRVETALTQAIDDGHPVLSRLPRVIVTYQLPDGGEQEFSDLTLPHRVFDGHIRAGTVNGVPIADLPEYRAARDAAPLNARALLEMSPATLVFGGWDATRRSHQGRWRSALVGEIIGISTDGTANRLPDAFRGGARVDPVGMSIQVTGPVLKELADGQRAELSPKKYDEIVKKSGNKPAEPRTASVLGIGGIPPSLSTLAGVACRRIIRSHVLSFATLRQMRFGAGPVGDAACRALLAALALNGLARSDAELFLRANCDLVEAELPRVTIDGRGGQATSLKPLSIAEADALLETALERAEADAGVRWHGVALRVTGNPQVAAGAQDAEDDAE